MVAPSVHALEDGIIDVLNGNIQIFDNLRLPGDDVNEIVGHFIGVQVVNPNPGEALNFT